MSKLFRSNIVLAFACMVALGFMAQTAFAAIVTNAITVNGGPSATIPYGGSVLISSTITTSANDNWRCTQYGVANGGLLPDFVNSNDHDVDPGETATESLTTAPLLLTPGIYDVNVRGHSTTGGGSCTGTVGTPLTLANAVTITQAPQAITFGALSGKVYGDADFAVVATVASPLPSPNSGLPVDYSASGACTVAGNMVSLTGAGLCTITASQAGDANYAAATPVAQSFTVAPKTLVPSIAGISKVYDGTAVQALAPVQVLLAGIVGIDTVYVSGPIAMYNNKNVGVAKPVELSGLVLDGPNAANYVLSTTTLNTTGDITALPITVTAQPSSKVYDGDTTSSVSPVWGMLGLGDAATFIQSYVTKTVGTMKQVFAGGAIADGNGGLNYILNFVNDTTSDISAKSVTISGVSVDSKVYDGNNTATLNTAGALLVGKIPADDVSIDWSGAVAVFDNKNAGTGKFVTVTGVSLTGTDAANYSLSQPTGLTADVSPLPISVTGDFARPAKEYDATNLAEFRTNVANMNIMFAPAVLGGDDTTLDLTSAIGTLPSVNVGAAQTVVFSGFSLTGGDAANYTLIAQPANETQDVTARPIVISAVPDVRVYDGTANSALIPVITTGSLVGTDTYTATQVFMNKLVGSGKTLVASGVINDGNGGANYATSWANVFNGEITARPLVVTVDASDKVYDGNRDATVMLADDRIMGDMVTVSYTTAKFGNKKADPSKTVTVNGITLSGIDAANYSVAPTATDVPVAITPRPLAINAAINNKVYDGNTNAGAISYTHDALMGDSISPITWGPANFDTKNVGTGKTVTFVPSIIPGLLDNDNYSLPATVTAIADITPRVLAVTAIGDNKPYDGTTAATAVLSDDRHMGDDLTVAYASAGFDTAEVGNGKTITINGLSASGPDAINYSILPTVITTTGNITTTTVNVTANNITKELDQMDPALTYTPNTLLGTSMFTGSLVRDAGETLGDYPILVGTLNPGSNYTMMFTPGVFTITKKSQSITIDPIATTDFGSADFAVNATATSMLPVAFIGTPGICSVSGNMVHLLALGNCTITAMQPGDMVYAAAPNVTTSFVINDMSAPTLTVNGTNPTIVEVLTGTYTELGVTVTDNHFSGTPTVTTSGTVDTMATGSYTITYTATDDYANTGTATRTVNVVDTVKPVITLNGSANIMLYNGDPYVELGATALDNYDIALTVAISGSVNTTMPGVYTITYNATDMSGNAADAVVRTISVSDADAPMLHLPTPPSYEADIPGGKTVEYTAVTATDTLDGTLLASCSPVSGSTFPVGVNTVTCDVTNSHGKTATGTFSITVVDTMDPMITAPAEQTFEATGSTTNPTLSMATGTDTVDSSVDITYSPSTFTVGTHTVTWTAMDDSGNSNSTTSTVIITDTTAPVIDAHANENATATMPSGATVHYTSPAVTDVVDGTTAATCTPASGSAFARGTTLVTCTAVDTAGNAAMPTTFSVIVSDLGAPVITLIGGNTVTLPFGTAFVDPGSSVADDVDTGLVATVTGLVNTSVAGTYTLTYTAQDNATPQNVAVPVVRTIIVEPAVSSGGGGGGGSSASSGFVPFSTPTTATTTMSPKLCPITKKYWDIGDRNNEVKNIQMFLNEYQGEKLKISRLYGKETFEAVKRFQVKYAAEILEPWGLTAEEATGFWYMATARHAHVVAGCTPAEVVLPNGKTLK